MAIKGQSITVSYSAWNTSTNTFVTGDTANHSISVVKDGGARAAAANAPAEIDATNMPGKNKITFSAAEMTCAVLTPAGKSSTANVVLLFAGDIITEQGVLPGGTTAGASGGVPVLDANLTVGARLLYIISTLLTESVAGYLAAAYKKFFNVAAPTSTMNEITLVDTVTTYTGNTPQTGDAFSRLGAPAGASIAADLAEIEAETDGIAAIPTGNPTVAQIATGVWQDATAGDFTVANSIGKLIYNAFTANSSVFTVAALANAPSGGGGGSDPLTNAAGHYATGTIGGIIQQLVQQILTVTSPLLAGAVVRIVEGDDYKAVDNRALLFPCPSTTFGDLTGDAVSFVAVKAGGNKIGPIAGSIVSGNTSNQSAQVEVPSAATLGLSPSLNESDPYQYSVRVTRGGDLITTFSGRLILSPNLFA